MKKIIRKAIKKVKVTWHFDTQRKSAISSSVLVLPDFPSLGVCTSTHPHLHTTCS